MPYQSNLLMILFILGHNILLLYLLLLLLVMAIINLTFFSNSTLYLRLEVKS